MSTIDREQTRRASSHAHERDRRPALLLFASARSGACRRADAFLAQVLQRRRNHETFRLLRLDVDRHPALVERFRVTEVPTLLIVADGRVRARLATPRGCAAIGELLEPWLQ